MQMLLAYSGGLLLTAGFSLAPWLYGLAAGLAALLGVLSFRTYRRAAFAFLFIAILACGGLMGAWAKAKAASFPATPGEEAMLVGRASWGSEYRGNNRYRLLLALSEVDGAPWRGQVYLYYEGGPLKAGDMVAARGKVMRFTPYGNPGAFNYDAYMKRQGVAAAISCYFDGEVKSLHGFAKPGGTVRERLLQAMDETAGDASALLKGVFLGEKSDLSFSQRSALSFAGVMDAFSVSGLHIGYLVAAALLLAGGGRRRRWQRLLFTSAFLLFYLNLTGLPASVLRAGLMALTMLAAAALDEKNDSPTTLSLAALICLLYKPLWLFDAGFQLSFAALCGISYLLPTMRTMMKGRGRTSGPPAEKETSAGVAKAPSWFSRSSSFLQETFAITFAATFAIMPLISYYFYHISLVGWLLSPLTVIGTGITVLLCFTAALAAIFSVPLACLPLATADIIMRPLMALSIFSADLPGAYIASGQTPLWAVALFYIALLALPQLAQRRFNPRLFSALYLLALVIFLSLAPALAHPADGQMEVVFIDVGQGDAALIITPQGQSILIDGGGNRMSSGKVGETALLPYLRYRGLKRIDLIINSHPDDDHIDGLFTVLENMEVGQLLYADAFPENALQKRMLALAHERGVTLVAAYAGQRYALAPGLTLAIVNPPAGAQYNERNSNEGCLSFFVSYGQVSFLFTGDASFGDLASLPPAQIVKLPHHGSKGAYDEDSYALLPAEAVVISVGRDNSYGHPGVSVVKYWQERAALFRTDLQGAVTIKSDGLHWRASTYY